eukprot:562295-Rhodomonas_salina.3
MCGPDTGAGGQVDVMEEVLERECIICLSMPRQAPPPPPASFSRCSRSMLSLSFSFSRSCRFLGLCARCALCVLCSLPRVLVFSLAPARLTLLSPLSTLFTALHPSSWPDQRLLSFPYLYPFFLFRPSPPLSSSTSPPPPPPSIIVW